MHLRMAKHKISSDQDYNFTFNVLSIYSLSLSIYPQDKR